MTYHDSRTIRQFIFDGYIYITTIDKNWLKDEHLTIKRKAIKYEIKCFSGRIPPNVQEKELTGYNCELCLVELLRGEMVDIDVGMQQISPDYCYFCG